ncbi:hypothetical protein PybrP1_006710 [[Pythium] brassicae (nom. inval.)]|nr:hypothetical protein PybrP1_006710 [[Pythium] brassicae (nom. inval.)]
MKLRVAAKDGEVGIYTPVQTRFKQPLVVPTVANVQGGRAAVPILNVHKGRAKLSPRPLLSTWESLDAVMTAVEVSGGLRRGAVDALISAVGRKRAESLPGDEEFTLGGGLVGKDRELYSTAAGTLSASAQAPRRLPAASDDGRAGKQLPSTYGDTGTRTEQAHLRRRQHHLFFSSPRAGRSAAAAEAGVGGREVPRTDGPGGDESVCPPRELLPQDRSALRRANYAAGALATEEYDVSWGDAERRTSEAPKHSLVTRPVPQYPDFWRPFVLVTDVSKVGVGAALMQDNGGNLMPVAYASSVKSAVEAKSNVTEEYDSDVQYRSRRETSSPTLWRELWWQCCGLPSTKPRTRWRALKDRASSVESCQRSKLTRACSPGRWTGTEVTHRRGLAGSYTGGAVSDSLPRDAQKYLSGTLAHSADAGAAKAQHWSPEAEPLHVTPRKNVYVVAVTEYLSKYMIAVAVPNRAATTVAKALINEVVLRHGLFRKLLADGTKELVDGIMGQPTMLLQARLMAPAPYRPNHFALFERFNRTWKYKVSLTTYEARVDWNDRPQSGRQPTRTTRRRTRAPASRRTS